MVRATRRTTAQPTRSKVQARSPDASDLVAFSAHAESLATLGQLALDGITANSFFNLSCGHIAETLALDVAAVMEIQDDGGLCVVAEFDASADSPRPETEAWLGTARFTYPLILRRLQTDEHFDSRARSEDIPHLNLRNVLSAASIPVGPTNQAYGALCVYSRKRRRFSSEDVSYLKAVANIIASVIERTRAVETLKRDAEERTLLGELSRIMSSSLDIDDVYPMFAEHVKQLIGFDRITISRVDEVNGLFWPTYVAGTAVDGWETGAPRRIAGRSVEAVIRLRRGLIVQDDNVEEFLRRFPDSDLGASAGIHSLLSVPIPWKDEIIGVLAFRSKSQNAYSDRDLQFAERVVAHIAGAVANSKLHATLRQYAEEQANLAAISRIVASSAHIEQIYPKFADCVLNLIPADRIVITTLNEARQTVITRYVWGQALSDAPELNIRPLAGSLTEAVVSARCGLIIAPESAERQDSKFAVLVHGLKAGLRSTLAVPLLYRDAVIGALILRSRIKDTYSLRHVTIAERVAVQISGAVWNAALNERLETAAVEQALLAQLAANVIRAKELGSIFEGVHATVSGRIQFDRLVVGLLNEHQSRLELSYVRGTPVPGHEEGSVVNRSADSRVPAVWSDVLGPYVGRSYRPSIDPSDRPAKFKRAGLNSWLQMPLKSGGRLLGIISLRSRNFDAYSPTELQFMERVADQTAAAVEHVQMIQRASYEMELRNTMKEMIRSADGAGPMIDKTQRILERLRQQVPFQYAICSDARGSGHRLILNGSTPGSETYAQMKALDPELDHITALVMRDERARVFVGGIVESGAVEVSATFGRTLARFGICSSLSIPIVCNDSTVSVLHLLCSESIVFSHVVQDLCESVGLLLGRVAITSPAPGALEGHDLRLAGAEGSNELTGTTSESPVDVLVVDRHGLCRKAFFPIFRNQPIRIVAESPDIEGAASQAAATRPNVILWEIHGGDALESSAVRSLRESSPDSRLFILDNGSSLETLNDAIRAGATGFLLKAVSSEKLVDSLREVAAGGVVIDSQLLAAFLEQLPTTQIGPSIESVEALSRLSERDVKILALVASGRSNAEIAETMKFAVGTIKNRIARIYRILEVGDRAEAMGFAIRAGIVK